jgi:hypothetical protein
MKPLPVRARFHFSAQSSLPHNRPGQDSYKKDGGWTRPEVWKSGCAVFGEHVRRVHLFGMVLIVVGIACVLSGD